MRTLVELPIDELRPTVGAVLAAQDLPEGAFLAPRLRRLVDDAFATYASLAEPRAVYQEIAPTAFLALLAPADAEAPVARVASRARRLALYVATLGPALPERIERLFAGHALAEGYLLDAVASAGADLLSERLATRFARLPSACRRKDEERTLPYSPGYCGWPTCGQRALFHALAPDEVGVSLNDSCLMLPLKSVSGVLVSAPATAHRFGPEFALCEACRTRECSRRLASLLSSPQPAGDAPAAAGTRS